MAFTKLNDDLNIVAKLDNEPNDVGGLTPAELKAVFDEAGNKIQMFLNDSLIAELEGENGAKNIGIFPIEGVSSYNLQAALESLKSQLNDATTGAIPDGSIEAIKLATDSVETDKILNLAVTTAKIDNKAVTNEKIDSVSASKITGQLLKTQIGNKQVDRDLIANFAVDTDQLREGAVTELKIKGNAVTKSKIMDGNVTAEKLSEHAVGCKFNNVSVDAMYFVDDTTYPDFPKKCSLNLAYIAPPLSIEGDFDVTSDMTPEVVFSVADATSGNFAPVAETFNGGVNIYAAEAVDTVIPTIVIWR